MNWENIETDRLFLKGFDTSDIPFLLAHFSDDFVCRYLFDAEPFTTLAEAEQLVAHFAADDQTTLNRWVIIDKVSRLRLGTCGFMFWDRTNNSIEIGYDLREAHSRQGIMSEALSAIINVAFAGKGLNRIQAITSVDNVASCGLLEKLGFKQEGIIRDKHFFRGRYYDHYCYSHLKREWDRRAGESP